MKERNGENMLDKKSEVILKKEGMLNVNEEGTEKEIKWIKNK